MITIPAGFDYQLLFGDYFTIAIAFIPIILSGFAFTLIVKGTKRSTR